MCGRFVLQNSGQIPLRFAATADTAVQAALADRYNIAPTEAVPIVTEGAPGARQVELAAWGLTPRWRGAKPMVAFNARAESLTERPMFRGLVARPAGRPRLRLVRVDRRARAEDETAVVHHRPGRRRPPRPRRAARPLGRSGRHPARRLRDVTTAAATDDLRALHDRMPVSCRARRGALARPGDDGGRGGAAAARAPGGRRLRRWPVSTAVNRSGHSDPALIGPLNPA